MAQQNSIIVVAALLSRASFGQNEICIFQRANHVTGAGVWEFPGGKRRSNEGDQEALRREIREELNIDVQVGSFIHQADHQFPSTGKKICLKLYQVSTQDPLHFDLVDHADYAWVNQDSIRKYKMSTADLAFIPIVFERLR